MTTNPSMKRHDLWVRDADQMAKLTARTARIVAAGEAAYGARWQSSLARAACVPQSLLAMIAGGHRLVSDEAYRKVAEGLLRESDRLRKAADKIDEMAGRMLAELDR